MSSLGRRIARLSGMVAAVSMVAAACGSVGQQTPNGEGGDGGGGEITGAGGGSTTGITTASTTTSTTNTGGTGGAIGSGPPYPFVLAHGFFGFDEFAGLAFETYFFNVKEHLAAEGEMVLTSAVDPFNDSDSRGEQLAKQVEDFLQLTGAAKVNIIGHSQGGLDARVVADLHPELVASVITISTPHHGTPVADIAMKVLGDPNAQGIIDALVKLIGGPLYDTIGNKTSLSKALDLFSTPGITAFNQKHPNRPGVFYASIAGRSALHLMGDDCEPDVVLPFVETWESELDPLNALFAPTGFVLAGATNIIHDGLVRARDAKWGEYWGCLPADHVDEVGQILGQNPGFGNDWKYLQFYSDLIGYMRQLGY